jgi:cephalosporin hydroxylase
MNQADTDINAVAFHQPACAGEDLARLSHEWMVKATRLRQAFPFPEWMGRPIIQLPFDMMAMQEIIWRTRPQLIIETGIAHGGSLIYHASLLELIGEGRVLGIDVDIRPHNRTAIEAHPMFHRIEMIQGSSLDESVVHSVAQAARDMDRVMVVLDSNHTHDHVLGEMRAYAPYVTPGCYLVVFDTIIEHLPADMFPDRAWGPGNNPMTAVREYLQESPGFEIDRDLLDRLIMTVAPDGYLKRLDKQG